MDSGVRRASHVSARFSAAAIQLSCMRRVSGRGSGNDRMCRISSSTRGFTCSQNAVIG